MLVRGQDSGQCVTSEQHADHVVDSGFHLKFCLQNRQAIYPVNPLPNLILTSLSGIDRMAKVARVAARYGSGSIDPHPHIISGNLADSFHPQTHSSDLVQNCIRPPDAEV